LYPPNGSRLNRPSEKSRLSASVHTRGHPRHAREPRAQAREAGCSPTPAATIASEARRGDRRRLITALLLTTAIAIAEVIGGYLTNSLALMSDAGHMLTDISALGLSLVALWFAGKPANVKKTYGYYRLEILSALANGVLLLGITVIILVEAYHRFGHPEPVRLGPMAVVTAVGLVANIAALKILHRRESLNVRGAFLHVFGDTLSSVGVLAGAAVMWATGWFQVDAIISAAISVVIVLGAYRLVRDAVDVLPEPVAAPAAPPAGPRPAARLSRV